MNQPVIYNYAYLYGWEDTYVREIESVEESLEFNSRKKWTNL